jgi:phosphotransferase system  glucose/maltose/N-acetylglucosamine-specific IIC component
MVIGIIVMLILCVVTPCIGWWLGSFIHHKTSRKGHVYHLQPHGRSEFRER